MGRESPSYFAEQPGSMEVNKRHQHKFSEQLRVQLCQIYGVFARGEAFCLLSKRTSDLRSSCSLSMSD